MAKLVNDHSNYRNGLVEGVKIAGQMIIDMAEDIVGNIDYMSALSIYVDFDQEKGSIPEVSFTRSHVPGQKELYRLLDLFYGKEEET